MWAIVRFVAKIIIIRALVRAWKADRGGFVSAPQGNEGPMTSAALQSPPAGDVQSPLDLEPGDWKQTGKRTLREIKDDRITLVAAGMAYYWFLAIFPGVIAAVGILALINAGPDVIEGINESITTTLPGAAGAILTESITNAQSASQDASLVAAILGIAVALWSASSGMVALQAGLDVAYDVKQERKFVKKRAIAFVLIAATGLLGGVPSPFFTFGDALVFTILGWVLTLAAVVLLFALYYRLGPNRPAGSWKWVSPGGLLGAGVWIVVSLAFGFYVDNFGKYAETYGALAGVVVLILWLYLTALSILIGGELNAELENQGDRRERAAGARA